MRLIPFHIFSHEGQFEVYNNEQRLKELKAKYQNCYTNNRTIMGRGKRGCSICNSKRVWEASGIY